MKLTGIVALAVLGNALQLEKNYLAQVTGTETIGDVTHPDVSGVEPTILDRERSTKKQALLSYQVFFDGFAESIDNTEMTCGENFVEDKHICCFRFSVD